MRPFIISISFLYAVAFGASTPLKISIGYHGGYDSNVLRFSQMEIENSSNNKEAMGGANSFDSYINKINTRLEKTIFQLGKKEMSISSSLNLSNYIHNSNKDYWSGNVIATYKWGSYKNIKYIARHLNRYYLRHYIDRDVSTNSLSFGFGYLQRYYDNPFTEFDLDIYYTRIRLNKRIKKFGTVSLQLDRISADNISFNKTAVSSNFDRSYEGLEWYLPIKIDKNLSYFDQMGLSLRQEIRVYEAEALDDALHSGRDHKDIKIDLWIKKKIGDELEVTFSSRFRQRDTESSYDWVSDLKSFNQMQIWCKIKWAFTYDNY